MVTLCGFLILEDSVTDTVLMLYELSEAGVAGMAARGD